MRVEGNKIVAWWLAGHQFATGEYDIVLYYKKDKTGQGCCDQCRFVRLVAHSAQADNPCAQGDVEEVVKLQPVTLRLSGMSAYDIAVAHGFEGTEAEWLLSLKGENVTASVMVENLDSLYSTLSSLTPYKPKIYMVVAEGQSNTYVVGILHMFSDSAGHMLTQVLMTHYDNIKDGRLDTSSHNDDKIYTYWRSYHVSGGTSSIPDNSWGQWQLLYGSDTEKNIRLIMENSLTESMKGAPNGVASLGEDGKVPLSQLPDKIPGAGGLTPTYTGNVSGITVETMTLQKPKHILYDTTNGVFVATMNDALIFGASERYMNNWAANEENGILGASEYGTMTEKGVKPMKGKIYIDTKNKSIGFWDKASDTIVGIPCTISANEIDSTCV